MDGAVWPWAALAALGATHGINPGMGWLFAVALGIQENDGRAVWKAMGPLAAGHALAILIVLATWLLLGAVLPGTFVQWSVAALLFALGVRQLVRHGHPRYGGMRIGPGRLTVWSFLMASAHGAGLMALPIVMATPSGGHGAHGGMTLTLSDPALALAGSVVHAAGYLGVVTLVALVVYHRIGVARLRTMWLNVNLVWGGALVITAVLVPFV